MVKSRDLRHWEPVGVGLGGRVAGDLPNRAEAVIAMLATSSLGAIYFGSQALLPWMYCWFP